MTRRMAERGTYLLGVLEVLEESLLSPGDALVHVSGSVGVAVCLTGLATENATNHNIRQSLRLHQTMNRHTRGGWGRLCGARQQRGCGTGHTGS